MAIKHKIKFKIDRGRGTSPAELRSSGPKLRPDKGSVESSALDGESTRRGVPADDMKKVIGDEVKVKDLKSVFNDKTVSDDYKTGGAYKAILAMFAKHFKDKKKNENDS